MRFCSSKVRMIARRAAAALAPNPTRSAGGSALSAAAMPAATFANVTGEKSQMQTADWRVVLARDLPSSVAPKKVQNGISSQPHAMPHMSKAAFGHEASKKMPRNPLRRVKSIVATLMRDTRSVLFLASASSVSNSPERVPARLAARVTKYGGSSPIAVPAPQTITAGHTSTSLLKKVSVPSPWVPYGSKRQGWLYTLLNRVDWCTSTSATTRITKGQRNMMPECRPEPKPMDERMPSTSHQPNS
mmetsp:Transcript_28257/g.90068  ORF Transcript_28257/g.90068 Transcript_28257/m.90068 type:complete len:245 (-) Transcript_28257:373-1107(-)